MKSGTEKKFICNKIGILAVYLKMIYDKASNTT